MLYSPKNGVSVVAKGEPWNWGKKLSNSVTEIQKRLSTSLAPGPSWSTRVKVATYGTFLTPRLSNIFERLWWLAPNYRGDVSEWRFSETHSSRRTVRLQYDWTYIYACVVQHIYTPRDTLLSHLVPQRCGITSTGQTAPFHTSLYRTGRTML